MGGYIFLFLVIFFVYQRVTSKGGVTPNSGDQPAAGIIGGSFVWLFVFVIIIIGAELFNTSIVASYALASPILFPGFISKLFSQFGLVKTSYYLSKISFFYFARDRFSGAILRGLQAANHSKNAIHKQKYLLWLKRKILNRKGKIYSGTMVMYVILESLSQSENAESTASKLDILTNIGSTSIPASVSSLALKLSLAPALEKPDWKLIFQRCDQWDTPAKNSLAKCLREFCGVYVLHDPVYTRTSLFFKSITLWRYPALRHFLKSQKSILLNRDDSSEPTDALLDLWQSRTEPALLYRMLTNTESRNQWCMRAAEIGVQNTEAAWSRIERSVAQATHQNSKNGGVLSTSEREHIEHRCKTLYYLTHTIEKKRAEKLKDHGIYHFLDWWRILQILNDLEPYKDTQLLAFSNMHNTLWNWVADLWNIKKERCLAHFIAGTCAPYAERAGITRMHEIMCNVASGYCR